MAVPLVEIDSKEVIRHMHFQNAYVNKNSYCNFQLEKIPSILNIYQ